MRMREAAYWYSMAPLPPELRTFAHLDSGLGLDDDTFHDLNPELGRNSTSQPGAVQTIVNPAGLFLNHSVEQLINLFDTSV
jgi:hypothetical protein